MGLRRRQHLPLITTVSIAVFALAGCAHGNSDHSQESGHAALAGLTVHIGLFGGPARAGGGMALSDSPAQLQNVTAVDDAGRKFRALTDTHGMATLQLAEGRYTVFSTYCGTGPRHVVLTASRTTRIQVACPVP